MAEYEYTLYLDEKWKNKHLSAVFNMAVDEQLLVFFYWYNVQGKRVCGSNLEWYRHKKNDTGQSPASVWYSVAIRGVLITCENLWYKVHYDSNLTEM